MPIQQQPKERKLKGVMDIVLCIDATESMTPCIDQLKENLKTFIDSFDVSAGSQQIIPNWRARVIYFRDLNVDDEALKEFPFVNTVEDLKQQINSIEAKGGGDQPESILDALYIAITKSDWREKALHAVIAFTDAPPHNELHPSILEPGQDTSIATIINAYVNDKYSKLWVYCPSHEKYKELQLIPRATIDYIDHSGDVYEGLINLDFDKLLKELGKTLVVSASEILKI